MALAVAMRSLGPENPGKPPAGLCRASNAANAVVVWRVQVMLVGLSPWAIRAWMTGAVSEVLGSAGEPHGEGQAPAPEPLLIWVLLRYWVALTMAVEVVGSPAAIKACMAWAVVSFSSAHHGLLGSKHQAPLLRCISTRRFLAVGVIGSKETARAIKE